MAQTRRDFLRNTACGAVSAAALLSGLDRLSMVNAMTQANAEDYKALVCIFLFGGNDSNNMIVPYTEHAYYAQKRGPGLAISQNLLHRISPPSAEGLEYGFHNQMGQLHQLWGEGHLAVLCNVGTLKQPTTRADYLGPSRDTYRPYQLFSHSDQQVQWQNSYAYGPYQIGWGGRTADLTQGISGDVSFPVATSIAGNAMFGNGKNTSQLIIAAAPTALNQALPVSGPADLIESLKQLLEVDNETALVKNSSDVTRQAFSTRDKLNQDPSVDQVTWPNTGLANQLKQVAKLITISPNLGLKRQIFFCSLGGFDTHTNQRNNANPLGNVIGQDALLRTLSEAMTAFYRWTEATGVASQVTTFTHSDFARTFTPGTGANTTGGSDHGWGSHQLIMGGAVSGGDFYGRYPDVTLTGPDDTDTGTNPRGRWIPTTSVEQYAATLALWYGLAPSDVPTVFRNIGRFDFNYDTGLGFLDFGAASRAKKSGLLSKA